MKKVFSLLLFLASLLLAIFAIYLMTPIVGDYYSFMRPVTLAFLSGERNLYDFQSPNLYYAPWAMGLWIPFVAYPYLVGQEANTFIVLLIALISIALLQKGVPQVAILLAVLNIPNLVLIVSGEVDALILFGVVIGYIAVRRKNTALLAVALFIMAMKPQNVLLVITFFLIISRAWKSVLLPIGAALASGFLIGLDWPLRYLSNLQSAPPMIDRRVELWRSDIPPIILAVLAILAIAALVYVVKRDGFNEWAFSLAIATNLVFSVYALWVHFVLLIPILLFLARRDWRLALIPWSISWFLPFTPRGAPWFGMIYPLTVFFVLWLVVLAGPQRTVADARLSPRA